MKVSKRADKTPLSPIRKFVPILQQIKKKGIKVYEIHIGQPDLKTPPEILNQIRKFKENSLIYTPSLGTERLRLAWKKYFSEFKISFDVAEIIPTIGGSEAIFFSFLAVTDPEDEIIVFEPFFTAYNSYAAMIGIKLVPVTTKAENGFHLPAKEVIKKKISKKTKAIVVCNPNNPTGTVYSKKELETVIDLAKKHDLFIIADETYRNFVFEGSHYSIMYFKNSWDRAIVLDSVSKAFSACGARIGCLATKNKEVIAAVTKFGQARLSLPMVEQEAVIPLLEKPVNYTKKASLEYKKRRDAVFSELQKIPGISCQEPKGAFYVVVKLPIKDAEAFTKWLLTDFRVKKETIMVTPAADFYASPGLGKNEIRIAYVLSLEKMKKAVRLLAIALKQYKG